MAKLITTSLIGAIEFYQTCPAHWKKDALKGLSNQLNRVKWEPTPAIQNGFDFEKRVELDSHKMKHMQSFELIGTDNYKSIVNKVFKGQFQRVTKKIVNIDGVEYCLYGRIDVYFPNKIVDLKTTGSYKKDKYLKTTQHLMYCYSENTNTFQYIIAEWDLYPTIKAVHIENYEMESREKTKEILFNRIRSAISFINKDERLKKAYNTTFCRF